MIYLVADCQGVFIAIDGIGRSGKITQQRIVYSLNNEGFYAKYTMEPINGLLGNFIKNKILKKMSPDIEALLFVADIYENINSEILPQLRTGENIVPNRYVYAFVAYQRSQGLNSKRNESLNFFCSEKDFHIY